MLDTHATVLVVAGIAALGAAVLPRLAEERPLSYPIIYVALGAGVFALPLGVELPDPIRRSELTEYLTEFGVIVALFGAGLKLDRAFGGRTWASVWLLLAVTMPLCIAAVALLGWWAAGLAPAAALLAASVLAPTDPVLASDVQVGPPGEDHEDEVRVALTAEAGLNDGLAFPFVNLAILLLAAGGLSLELLGEWVGVYVVYRIALGVVVGLTTGWLLVRFVFRLAASRKLSDYSEAFVFFAATLLSYGLTEIVGGYGFLAVFVTAVTGRSFERDHDYHGSLHVFSEQMERLVAVLLLVLFGGTLSAGLLTPLTWQLALVAAALVLLVRPASGMLALRWCRLPLWEKAAVSFFGIRGIGSFYYLAYAVNEVDVPQVEQVWALVGACVLASVVLHGVAATPVLRLVDRRRGAGRLAPTD